MLITFSFLPFAYSGVLRTVTHESRVDATQIGTNKSRFVSMVLRIIGEMPKVCIIRSFLSDKAGLAPRPSIVFF